MNIDLQVALFQLQASANTFVISGDFIQSWHLGGQAYQEADLSIFH
jgi:hypothetical protein